MSERKKIWITGASRGIGLGIVKNLIDKEYDLILSASSATSFDDHYKELRKKDNVYLFPFDVKDENAAAETYEKIKASLGEVDLLLCNAGVAKFKPLAELSIEEFDHMNQVNYRGVFLNIKAVLPDMIERKSGTIMTINSVAHKEIFDACSVYSASKSALKIMTDTLRQEVRKSGIKVVDIMPGPTRSEIWHPKVVESHGELMMSIEEIGKVIAQAIESSLNDELMIEEMLLRPQNGNL